MNNVTTWTRLSLAEAVQDISNRQQQWRWRSLTRSTVDPKKTEKKTNNIAQWPK